MIPNTMTPEQAIVALADAAMKGCEVTVTMADGRTFTGRVVAHEDDCLDHFILRRPVRGRPPVLTPKTVVGVVVVA